MCRCSSVLCCCNKHICGRGREKEGCTCLGKGRCRVKLWGQSWWFLEGDNVLTSKKKIHILLSKHLYPFFPLAKVLSGHSPQVNWPDSDRHCTPRKQGSPRHKSVVFSQNFPLNPVGHRHPTTWKVRHIVDHT